MDTRDFTFSHALQRRRPFSTVSHCNNIAMSCNKKTQTYYYHLNDLKKNYDRCRYPCSVYVILCAIYGGERGVGLIITLLSLL